MENSRRNFIKKSALGGPAPRQEYMHDTWDYNWHWYGWTYGTGETGNNAIHRLDFARRAMQVDYYFAMKYERG